MLKKIILFNEYSLQVQKYNDNDIRKYARLSLLILNGAATVLKKIIDINPVKNKENLVFFVIFKTVKYEISKVKFRNKKLTTFDEIIEAPKNFIAI